MHNSIHQINSALIESLLKFAIFRKSLDNISGILISFENFAKRIEDMDIREQVTTGQKDGIENIYQKKI